MLTDTLQSTGPVFADACQYRLMLFTEEWGVSPSVRGVSPSVRGVSIAMSDSCCHGEYLEAPIDGSLWGRELAVPVRSQMVYPDGGEEWCSPVSLSMVTAYWADRIGEKAFDQPVPAVVRGHTTMCTGKTATGRSTQRTLPLSGSMLRSDGSIRSGRSSVAWRQGCRYRSLKGTCWWFGASILRGTSLSTIRLAATTRVSGVSTAVTSSPGPGSAPAPAGSPTSFTRMASRRTAL